MSRVQVHRISVLSDNYSFLIEDTQEKTAVVVDPAESSPVVEALEGAGLRPAAIWITHRHADHTGGIEGLLDRYGKLPVYGSHEDSGQIPHQTSYVRDGDTVEFAGESAEVLSVPGHADGHIAYHLPKSGHVFSGDVVFGASCGKVFSGDFGQMYRSVSRIAGLPDGTRIWCGHEYTMGNLKFAAHVDPENPEIKRRLDSERPPTVPLDLTLEKMTSPFMRCSHPVVQQFTGKTDPVEVFAELRRRKDNF